MGHLTSKDAYKTLDQRLNLFPQGAQVTLYNAQKADGTLILENEVGEYETAVKRIHDDAPYLKQQNPVVTGKDGVYQWFVPSGLWYVEASKAGYSSGDSSCDINATIPANGTKYMPVLPPLHLNCIPDQLLSQER